MFEKFLIFLREEPRKEQSFIIKAISWPEYTEKRGGAEYRKFVPGRTGVEGGYFRSMQSP